MDPELTDPLIVAGVSFLAVVLSTPVVKRLAHMIGAVKAPRERDVHQRATPEIGGLAILFGVIVAILVATRLGTFAELFRTTSEPEAVMLAALVISLVGLVDDTRVLGPGAKLAGQVLAAGVLVLFGLTINFVYIPFGTGGIVSLSPDVAALVTILAVVAMINAVNLIDGLDGLAAGIVAIAASALFVYSQLIPQGELLMAPTISSVSLVLAAIIGACLGFLVFNTNPASIFMGDTGAMLLGLLLASAGVGAIGNTAEPTEGELFVASIPVLIPALVLAVPFLDTALAILRRLGSGRSLSSPDNKHIHHRLVEIGHSQRRAVLILYYWSALLAISVVGWSILPVRTVLTVIGVGALFGLMAIFLRRRRPRDGQLDQKQISRLDPDGKIVYSFTSTRHKRHRRWVDDG